MKFRKALLLLTGVVALANCSNDPTEHLVDTDFDGLYDKIDPDPNDNHYQIRLVDEENKHPSNPIDVTIDYRDFLVPDYNNNLAMLSSILINEVDSAYKPSVIYNSYKKDTSEFAPILTQIGCDNITWIKISDKPMSLDPYDIADLLAGHHTFKFEEKLHQVFFFLIKPYPFKTGWISNFDLGGTVKNSEGKLELSEGFKTVEGELHPQWADLNHHKGFDVTSERLVSAIETYIKENKNAEADQIVLTTGHSRGGAITNLATKKLIDLGYNAKGYAFNPPKTTLTTDKKYNHSIFNFVNKNDFVSRVPLSKWNFDYYGDVREVDVSKYDSFKKLLNRDYKYNSEETLSYLESKLEDLCRTESASPSTRDNEFEFYYKEWTIEFKNADEVNNFLESIKDLSPLSKNSVSAIPDGNKVTIKFRPSIFMGVIADVTGGDFIFNLDTYLAILFDFALELINDLIKSGVSLSINGFRLAHEQPIACVLATLANQQN